MGLWGAGLVGTLRILGFYGVSRISSLFRFMEFRVQSQSPPKRRETCPLDAWHAGEPKLCEAVPKQGNHSRAASSQATTATSLPGSPACLGGF